MNIDDMAMHDIIRAFIRSTKKNLEQSSIENNFVTGNGEALYSWNYILGNIAKAAKNNGLEHIVVKRNIIWEFVAV